jgi:membrane-associated phospholipid phosphatase
MRTRQPVQLGAMLVTLGFGAGTWAQSLAASLPSIAPPDPGAPPAKVEAAQEQAKKAQLTPILPSPRDPTRPAFQLYAEVDLPVLGVGLVFAGARLIPTQPPFCAPLCQRASLNVLDRLTAGYWSPAWATASDVSLISIGALAAMVLVVDEGPLPALNDALVVSESALTALALSTVLTLVVGRPRPFEYGTEAPLSERLSANAGASFVSSHASVSFAIALSTAMAARRLSPGTAIPLLVLGLGGAAATFVATARVMGGQHFITDSLAGAVIGTSVGIIVPALHGSPVKIVPVISPTAQGLGVTGNFY